MFQTTVVVDVVIIVVVVNEKRLHREHMWLLTFDRDTCWKIQRVRKSSTKPDPVMYFNLTYD